MDPRAALIAAMMAQQAPMQPGANPMQQPALQGGITQQTPTPLNSPMPPNQGAANNLPPMPAVPLNRPMGAPAATPIVPAAAPMGPAPQQPLPLARLGQLQLERNLAGRGLPAAGSPSTPFAGMSTQPIPLQ